MPGDEPFFCAWAVVPGTCGRTVARRDTLTVESLRRALVTGGSRGHRRGNRRSPRRSWRPGRRDRPECRADTPNAHFIAGDISTPEGAAAIADAALHHLGGVDIIVNNAGGATAYPAAIAIASTAWQDALDVNFLSAVRLNATLLPQVLERGTGAIVHIASSSVLRVPSPLLHYGASKAALIAYSKGLATELAPKGIRVNTITPGSIQTPGADKTRAEIAAGLGIDPAARVENIPVGRIGRAEEIAEAVAYRCPTGPGSSRAPA
jgi:NAD(P)-dependent dehydrogenase (short-subunit alcohol dehydrogenase family)